MPKRKREQYEYYYPYDYKYNPHLAHTVQVLKGMARMLHAPLILRLRSAPLLALEISYLESFFFSIKK